MDRALFATATSVQIGDGKTAKFWTDSWLHGIAPAGLFPNLYNHSRRKNRTVEDALQEDKWTEDVNHNWTMELLAEYVTLFGLVTELDESRPRTQPDSITWTATASGEYSTSSAYRLQFEGGTTSNYQRSVWKVWAPPKAKFFLWLWLQNRVWTADRLQSREWPNEYFCSLCYRSLETAGHLFMECPYSRSVWAKVATWTATPSLQPANWEHTENVEDWYLTLPRGVRPQGIKSLAILVIWELWKERNSRIFHQKLRTEQQMLAWIQGEAANWIMAGPRNWRR